MRIPTIVSVLLMGAGLGLSSRADAQIYDLDFGALMLSQNISSVVTYTANTNLLAQQREYDERVYGSGRGASRSSGAQSWHSVDFSMRYDPRVSSDAKRRFISAIRRTNGDRVADAIDAEFSNKSVHDAFRELSSPYGLLMSDYGDVFTAYLVTMWMVANQAPPPDVASVRGVSDQAHAILARNGLQGSRHERQLTAERMMYELVSAIYGRQEAQRVGDSATLNRMAMLARNKFLESGLDLQAMVLDGGNGLVRR